KPAYILALSPQTCCELRPARHVWRSGAVGGERGRKLADQYVDGGVCGRGREERGTHGSVVLPSGEGPGICKESVEGSERFEVGVDVDTAESPEKFVPKDIRGAAKRIRFQGIFELLLVAKPRQFTGVVPGADLPIGMKLLELLLPRFELRPLWLIEPDAVEDLRPRHGHWPQGSNHIHAATAHSAAQTSIHTTIHIFSRRVNVIGPCTRSREVPDRSTSAHRTRDSRPSRSPRTPASSGRSPHTSATREVRRPSTRADDLARAGSPPIRRCE